MLCIVSALRLSLGRLFPISLCKLSSGVLLHSALRKVAHASLNQWSLVCLHSALIVGVWGCICRPGASGRSEGAQGLRVVRGLPLFFRGSGVCCVFSDPMVSVYLCSVDLSVLGIHVEN